MQRNRSRFGDIASIVLRFFGRGPGPADRDAPREEKRPQARRVSREELQRLFRRDLREMGPDSVADRSDNTFHFAPGLSHRPQYRTSPRCRRSGSAAAVMALRA